MSYACGLLALSGALAAAPAVAETPEGVLPAAESPDLSLPAGIRAALDSSGIPPEALSLRVRDAHGVLRLDWQPDRVRETGSLIKLVTTLAALELLGPAHRFHTDLQADPRPGQPGVWTLWLRGGGDPALRYQDLVHLLSQAEAAGMRRLDPVVRIDSSRFAPVPPSMDGVVMAAGSVGAVAPGALQVEWSSLTLALPEDPQARPLADPPFPLDAAGILRVPASVPCPENWTDALVLDLPPPSRDPGGVPQASLRLQGRWPRACPATSLLRAPLELPQYLGLALTTAWQSLGHREVLTVASAPAPGYSRLALRQESRPLAELVHDINKYSNNVMARTLLLDLAAEAGELPATVAAGDRVVQAWLRHHGFDFPELHLDNGAGLSHVEQLSTAHLEMLLMYALTSPQAPEFVSSLPIPGQDGTLRQRFQDLAGGARLRLKSGSLDGVRSLAGFVLDGQGGTGTLVCILNHPHLERAQAVQSAVLAWVLGVEHATLAPETAPNVR